jgi:hypothetical protein
VKLVTQAQCTDRSANVAFFATFAPRGASSISKAPACSRRQTSAVSRASREVAVARPCKSQHSRSRRRSRRHSHDQSGSARLLADTTGCSPRRVCPRQGKTGPGWRR